MKVKMSSISLVLALLMIVVSYYVFIMPMMSVPLLRKRSESNHYGPKTVYSKCSNWLIPRIKFRISIINCGSYIFHEYFFLKWILEKILTLVNSRLILFGKKRKIWELCVEILKWCYMLDTGLTEERLEIYLLYLEVGRRSDREKS